MITITLTASDARENLYQLIKKASKGLQTFEIKLRGSEPVVLLSKSELESWEETLDIMSSPAEVEAYRNARKETKLYTESEIKRMLGLK
jgi:prevent-host-death family protein